LIPDALTGMVNHGIMDDFAAFLHATIKPGMRILETGSGISTLIFAWMVPSSLPCRHP